MSTECIQSTDSKPAHSPLGASSAERWMNCAGSVALIKALELPESDEEDWRRNGVAAHEAAAHCLQNNLDAWEVAGEKFHDTPVDLEIAEAIQVYLDHCRALAADAGQVLVETRISHPDHKLFYGTVDFAAVVGTVLHVRDYKHGQGIVVEADDNPQIMYYAYGLLSRHPEVETITLGIVQPRAFHPDGPIRVSEPITAAYLRDWAAEELIPAMLRTEMDNDLSIGGWCRFCPAKLVCPAMTALFGAAMQADPKQIVQLNNASLSRTYQMVQGVKFYLKALEEEVFRRMQNGAELEGLKLVHKKANRVWHDGAKDAAIARFGDAALSVPELKSPAEIERLSAAAKAWVKEHAYTPESGLTVALDDDKRPGVKMRSLKETFAAALDNESL